MTRHKASSPGLGTHSFRVWIAAVGFLIPAGIVNGADAEERERGQAETNARPHRFGVPGALRRVRCRQVRKIRKGEFSGCQTAPARSYFRPARKGDPHVRPDSSVGRAAD